MLMLFPTRNACSSACLFLILRKLAIEMERGEQFLVSRDLLEQDMSPQITGCDDCELFSSLESILKGTVQGIELLLDEASFSH